MDGVLERERGEHFEDHARERDKVSWVRDVQERGLPGEQKRLLLFNGILLV